MLKVFEINLNLYQLKICTCLSELTKVETIKVKENLDVGLIFFRFFKT